MIVVTLEYWPGADPTRRQPQGWAAVLRENRDGQHEWVVTLTVEGHRHYWAGPAKGTAIDAICRALTAIGAITGIRVEAWPSSSPPADRVEAVHRMTAAVESRLAGANLQPVPPLGAFVAAPPPHTAQWRTGARQRVLKLPMLTEKQVQDLYPGQRDHPAIVRGLRKSGTIIGLRHEGRRIFPLFQFAGARPHPLVAAVNLTLATDLNPWRAAIWWSSTNPVLGCRPLDLLYRPHEQDRLLTAARAHGGPHGQ